MSDMTMDFSALDTAASTATVESTEQIEVPEVEGTTTETVETPKELQTEEQKTAAAAEKEEKVTPSKTRAALKAWKEANPENKTLANELNNTVGRAEAFSKVFPGGVKEAQEFKIALEEHGGLEGVKNLSAQMDAVRATDALLYNGDPALIDNIIEDLKSSGHPEALGKLATPLLDKLYDHDRAAYNKVILPRVYGTLQAGMVTPLQETIAAFDSKNPEALKAGLTKLAQWYNAVQKASLDGERQPEVNPEVEKLKGQLSEKEKAETTAFKKEANAEATKNDNKIIVAAMTPMLKGNAFFKNFPKETLQELGKDIRTTIYSQLNRDKDVSAKVNAYLKSKDKAKAVSFWNQQVEKVSSEVAKRVIKSRYPGYDKTVPKGAVVEKVAPVTSQKFSNAKPIYVAQKPKWEELDFAKDPKQVMYILGKGYLKSGKFVTWKKV